MSCDAASLSPTLYMGAFSPSGAVSAAPAAQMVIVTPPSVAKESLFSDLVKRALTLRVQVDPLRKSGQADGGLAPLPGFDKFSKQVVALSARDM